MAPRESRPGTHRLIIDSRRSPDQVVEGSSMGTVTDVVNALIGSRL